MRPSQSLYKSSYKKEQKKWPEFRKFIENRIYGQTPSRFPLGLGVYSESLGLDMGLYTDPLDNLGYLSLELFRACRQVVDTGMHALGWSKEQAMEFMLTHTAASPDNIKVEVLKICDLARSSYCTQDWTVEDQRSEKKSENRVRRQVQRKRFP